MFPASRVAFGIEATPRSTRLEMDRLFLAQRNLPCESLIWTVPRESVVT